tara:strand:+ start:519 stop:719 length:201 start_codon:yes stop_codon:yes gene_type:complete
MKANEKAKELVVRFNYKNKHYLSLDAKQCALICVDEMLEEILSTPNVYELDTYYYWKKVKQEINKL